MDHLRVTDDGEVELDVRYFTDLFGEYLAKESRTVLVEGVYRSLFLGASDTPEAVLGEMPFEAYRDLISFHGLLSQLTQVDLEHLAVLARAGPGEVRIPFWEELQRVLGKEEYRSLPGVAQSDEIVSGPKAHAWSNLGAARNAQGDLPGAIAAYGRAREIKSASRKGVTGNSTAAGMEEANRIGYVGDPGRAGRLSSILPASMRVMPMAPGTTLNRMLGYLGYPDAVLEVINAAGAEELFARARAA